MLTELIREHARLSAEVRALEDRIDRERTQALAELPEKFGFADLRTFIRAMKDAARPTGLVGRGRRKRGKEKKTPAASVPPPPALKFPGQAVAKVAAPVAAPEPTGTSLDDPANFALLPDLTLLERGSHTREVYIEALGKALRFTERVLHTSKVPAKIWREWRQFERKVGEAIHAAKEEGRSRIEEE